MSFNATQYWAGCERPTWVVHLYHARQQVRRRVEDRETRYVRARSQSGAIATARAHSFMPARAQASARLATPQDLGCVAAGVAV